MGRNPDTNFSGSHWANDERVDKLVDMYGNIFKKYDFKEDEDDGLTEEQYDAYLERCEVEDIAQAIKDKESSKICDIEVVDDPVDSEQEEEYKKFSLMPREQQFEKLASFYTTEFMDECFKSKKLRVAALEARNVPFFSFNYSEDFSLSESTSSTSLATPELKWNSQKTRRHLASSKKISAMPSPMLISSSAAKSKFKVPAVSEITRNRFNVNGVPMLSNTRESDFTGLPREIRSLLKMNFSNVSMKVRERDYEISVSNDDCSKVLEALGARSNPSASASVQPSELLMICDQSNKDEKNVKSAIQSSSTLKRGDVSDLGIEFGGKMQISENLQPKIHVKGLNVQSDKDRSRRVSRNLFEASQKVQPSGKKLRETSSSESSASSVKRCNVRKTEKGEKKENEKVKKHDQGSYQETKKPEKPVVDESSSDSDDGFYLRATGPVIPLSEILNTPKVFCRPEKK